MIKRTVRSLLAGLLGFAQPAGSATSDIPDNFMVVLREVEGANKQDPTLVYSGPAKVTLADGKEADLNPAWFAFLGDIQVRFVYDFPSTMKGLTYDQFKALGVTPDQALAVAIANLKRTYGPPHSEPWSDGLMLVSGESPDLVSSYFLDNAFWLALEAEHPDGIVAAVPKRGGLLYAYASDHKAVESLRRGIRELFTSSGTMRVSSALYLYKHGKWSVLQPPIHDSGPSRQ